jgi:serine/threonine protein phosphatase PrpC
MAVQDVDKELLGSKVDSETSGTTLCGVLIKDSTVYCFFVGDSTCIMINQTGQVN